MNEELNVLHSSPNIVRVIKSRRMRWAEYVARMEELTGVYRVMVGKSEGKRPLGRPRHRWENIINIHLQGRGQEDMDLIHVAQDRDKWQDFVNTVINFQAAQKAEKYSTT